MHFVEAAQTLDAARERAQELGAFWPCEYVIHNEETRERVFITVRRRHKELNAFDLGHVSLGVPAATHR